MKILTRKHIAEVLLLTAFVGGMLAMTGCETAKGFGKDVEDTGKSIQKEAD
jgi:predicted small secreted protein